MSSFPLRAPSPGQCTALRHCLSESGFHESPVCERLQVPSVFGLNARRRPAQGPIADGLDALIQLFLEGHLIRVDRAEAVLGAQCLALLQEMGLVQPDAEDSGAIEATCGLYPAKGLILASDRWNAPEGRTGRSRAADAVYPAITSGTGEYLSMLPSSPCGDLLELCAGTGIAALDAARRYATHAYTCDITARSCEYTRWNALLNDLSNVTIAEGDLYAPFGTQQFDRIVNHPPYVPALNADRIYANGGEDGESISRAAIQRLPEVLRPGGSFYNYAMTTDHGEQTWETRIRGLLGEAEPDFDIAIFERRRFRRDEYLHMRVRTGENTPQEAMLLQDAFDRLGVTSLVFGLTVLRRTARGRSTFTLRKTLLPEIQSPHVEWLLDVMPWLADSCRHEALLDQKVRASLQLTLGAEYKLHETKWLPQELRLRAHYPFPAELDMPDWVIQTVASCDGTRTARQQWEQMKSLPDVPALSQALFLDLLIFLLQGGFLVLEDHPPPLPPPQPERPEEIAS